MSKQNLPQKTVVPNCQPESTHKVQTSAKEKMVCIALLNSGSPITKTLTKMYIILSVSITDHNIM